MRSLTLNTQITTRSVLPPITSFSHILESYKSIGFALSNLSVLFSISLSSSMKFNVLSASSSVPPPVLTVALASFRSSVEVDGIRTGCILGTLSANFKFPPLPLLLLLLTGYLITSHITFPRYPFDNPLPLRSLPTVWFNEEVYPEYPEMADVPGSALPKNGDLAVGA